MNLLDTFALKKRLMRRRYARSFFAKGAFYALVGFYALFVLITNVFFDEPTVIEVIPATRTEDEISSAVREYLRAKDVRGLNGVPPVVNCGDLFGNLEFTYEYLNRGSWRANAFYERVRYYWRVDDLSLEVTKDFWVRTYNATVKC